MAEPGFDLKSPVWLQSQLWIDPPKWYWQSLLYGCTTIFCLTIHPLKDIDLITIWGYSCYENDVQVLCEQKVSFLWDKCPGVQFAELYYSVFKIFYQKNRFFINFDFSKDCIKVLFIVITELSAPFLKLCT